MVLLVYFIHILFTLKYNNAKVDSICQIKICEAGRATLTHISLILTNSFTILPGVSGSVILMQCVFKDITLIAGPEGKGKDGQKAKSFRPCARESAINALPSKHKVLFLLYAFRMILYV